MFRRIKFVQTFIEEVCRVTKNTNEIKYKDYNKTFFFLNTGKYFDYNKSFVIGIKLAYCKILKKTVTILCKSETTDLLVEKL